jgi:hypothetical protein
MINFWRTLFGLGPATNTRTVAGNQVPVDIKEVNYIRDSTNRLHVLFKLCKSFKGTPQEQKITAVYEKTKNIHNYLVARKKAHELELFHIQHTEHFISTFTVILNACQGQPESILLAPSASASPPGPYNTGSKREQWTNGQQPARQRNGSRPLTWPEEPKTQIPRLAVPDIRINPTARIVYNQKEFTQEGATTRQEIGSTSSEEEKESFLAYISGHFGISNITYHGNALVNIPDTTGPNPTGLVPVIQWKDSLYAVNLTNGRLFPVKMV